METDWKKFHALVPVARDRYLRMRNAELVAMLTSSKKSATESFWEAAEAVEREAAVLRRCLDDSSRARMCAVLIEMHRAGMLGENDLTGFSEELRQRVVGFPP